MVSRPRASETPTTPPSEVQSLWVYELLASGEGWQTEGYEEVRGCGDGLVGCLGVWWQFRHRHTSSDCGINHDSRVDYDRCSDKHFGSRNYDVTAANVCWDNYDVTAANVCWDNYDVTAANVCWDNYDVTAANV